MSDDHRLWPRPERPAVIGMDWNDLLFAHWPVDAGEMREHLPPGLTLDTFEGQAWLAVVPFWMDRVGPLWLRRMPWLSRFAEMNVRTYVTVGDRPGVYFFSLDAANPLAVSAARNGFHLSYFNARMSYRWEDGWMRYSSRRTHGGAPPGEFRGRYRPTGETFYVHPGSLEYWLIERYCLYAVDGRGRVYRGEIDHGPWPLHIAEAEIEVNTLAHGHGIELLDTAPLLHFVHRQDVLAWMPERVSR